ncbi:hypothetical protein SAMN05216267_1022109 [Actinacidiphila rubida]|uniref:Uncharacterized protein n=1 Tax=Actinacidiphila rubida TaxID=310780 RepID=A0A1H8NK74_9ACTN|nr:hypothetical protein SAMN05216267_1022109 [Actinacidiphila rubida]
MGLQPTLTFHTRAGLRTDGQPPAPPPVNSGLAQSLGPIPPHARARGVTATIVRGRSGRRPVTNRVIPRRG